MAWLFLADGREYRMIVPLRFVTLGFLEAPRSPGFDLTVGLGSGAVGTFLTTLLVGAVLVALAPEYTRRKMDAVREDPVGSFVYGLVSLVGLAAAILLLFFTLIGIPLVIVLFLVALVLWSVGAAIAFLAIASQFVDPEDGWLVPLLLAAGINGGLTLTGVGGVVGFVVGAAGFGAILRDFL